MSTNNSNPKSEVPMQFTRQVAIRDIHGNTIVQTVTDRNAAHTEQRRLAAERSNLRGEFVRTMSRCVVLTPAEQAETGFYGRIHGVDGDLGVTGEDGWTWLTFPEWKEVIKATRQQFAAEDALLAKQQQGVKSALYGSRR